MSLDLRSNGHSGQDFATYAEEGFTVTTYLIREQHWAGSNRCRERRIGSDIECGKRRMVWSKSRPYLIGVEDHGVGKGCHVHRDLQYQGLWKEVNNGAL